MNLSKKCFAIVAFTTNKKSSVCSFIFLRIEAVKWTHPICSDRNCKTYTNRNKKSNTKSPVNKTLLIFYCYSIKWKSLFEFMASLASIYTECEFSPGNLFRSRLEYDWLLAWYINFHGNTMPAPASAGVNLKCYTPPPTVHAHWEPANRYSGDLFREILRLPQLIFQTVFLMEG